MGLRVVKNVNPYCCVLKSLQAGAEVPQPAPPHQVCMDEHSKNRQHCVYQKHTGRMSTEENSSTKNYNILELMSL